MKSREQEYQPRTRSKLEARRGLSSPNRFIAPQCAHCASAIRNDHREYYAQFTGGSIAVVGKLESVLGCDSQRSSQLEVFA
jgi:hypothetical protein